MMTYFKHIPLDLINLIIPLLNDPKSFDDFLASEDIEIKNRHWEIIFSYKFPKMFRKIKNVMKIDPTLRTPRYSKNWKELYLEFLKVWNSNEEIITEIHGIVEIPEIITEIHGIVEIPEVINLIYAIDLYGLLPQFYLRSVNIPGLFIKETIYNNINYIYYHVLEGFVTDLDFIEYFNSGKLNKYIKLSHVKLDFGLELILFMIQDFPDIIKGNEEYIEKSIFYYNDKNVSFVNRKFIKNLIRMIIALLPINLI